MEHTITAKTVELNLISIQGEHFYKISNNDLMRPFFMSLVSDSNHWMFISSNGGLSAGRKNAQYALFPYYTDDKLTEFAEITGSKTILLVQKPDQVHTWEPFSDRYEGRYHITRNLYKNVYGNKVLFEEENHDLNLTFRYQWNSSNVFGFVKKSTLINNANEEVQISVLDGLQNVLPYGIESDLQNNYSNLVDAYKRSELDQSTGLGIFALSAIIVDKAEPSEALKANIVWSCGFKNPKYLLSSLQLNAFRKRKTIQGEEDIKAEKGAYFIHENVVLSSRSKKEWKIVANVNQNHSAIAKISETIKSAKNLDQLLEEDIAAGTKRLIELNAAADGLQLTSDHFQNTRHFANTLFNIMRGGIFDFNYQIEKSDFSKYLAKANHIVFKKIQSKIQALPELFTLTQLQELAQQMEDVDFKRLCAEYMPLKFSRRHGDPSRPWNKFSINTHNENDGSKILDYQGNWRDIFQNWEALAHSYPEFMESMIHKFLNATTFDGYNPYRVTKDGFDWESIEPDDPWSYIGYWGDHQIIYLLKFLEFIENYAPGKLEQYYDQDIFVYANVPYKIKVYADLLKNPKDTIDFDHGLDLEVRELRKILGADGALIKNKNNKIYQINFIEKILATLLAKLSNFIPEGGIWMNTQRPEWNDANNALVGNGVSMVTLYYLRRFLTFFKKLLNKASIQEVNISKELNDLCQAMFKAFEQHQHLLTQKINDEDRKSVMDALGQASSDYRWDIYKNGFSGKKETISLEHFNNFINHSLQFIDHTIAANKKPDQLYHAYNLMTVESEDQISISYLSEMLEGQVAVLSSGYLSSTEALSVLDALKNSALFRADQYSYILYPNKNLPRFNEKNIIPEAAVHESALLTQLLDDGNVQIIEKDINGKYHFNGNFTNAKDLETTLNDLYLTKYAKLVEKDKAHTLKTFEKVFNHKAFTGRSGTFYGYEGLGSIYWHMVSKLRLAVQECCLKAIKEKASEETIGRLLEHYYEITAGIGVHKSPSLYGAFPTDPYSHTPAGKGAQQPGMTGQVKEDILCRFGELGVFIENGQLYFKPSLLQKNEFLTASNTFEYVDTHLAHQQIPLEKDSLCFTYCQVPIIYKIASEHKIELIHKDQSSTHLETFCLDLENSQKVFKRTGDIERIVIHINESQLK